VRRFDIQLAGALQMLLKRGNNKWPALAKLMWVFYCPDNRRFDFQLAGRDRSTAKALVIFLAPVWLSQ